MSSEISSGGVIAYTEGGEASLGDFITLLKPRVVALVVFTAWAGLLVAPVPMHPFIAGVSLFCVALAAAGAGAINMWYDHDIDALMERTKHRPTVRGTIEPDIALGFGIMLCVLAVMMMGLAVNHLAALCTAVASAFYVFVYTMGLKRRTPQNIVIGGAAGAFPPIIGWTASTASIDVYPVIMFLIIFLWTPPHFWALALARDTDYQRSAIPMLPNVKGRRYTQKAIVAYTLVLAAVTALPPLLSLAGAVYSVAAVFLNALFVYYAVRLYKKDDAKRCFVMFKVSILYLFLLFCAIIGDGLL